MPTRRDMLRGLMAAPALPFVKSVEVQKRPDEFLRTVDVIRRTYLDMSKLDSARCYRFVDSLQSKIARSEPTS